MSDRFCIRKTPGKQDIAKELRMKFVIFAEVSQECPGFFWGFRLCVFFLPIRNDPKTHQKCLPPGPGRIPQLRLCLCVFSFPEFFSQGILRMMKRGVEFKGGSRHDRNCHNRRKRQNRHGRLLALYSVGQAKGCSPEPPKKPSKPPKPS